MERGSRRVSGFCTLLPAAGQACKSLDGQDWGGRVGEWLKTQQDCKSARSLRAIRRFDFLSPSTRLSLELTRVGAMPVKGKFRNRQGQTTKVRLGFKQPGLTFRRGRPKGRSAPQVSIVAAFRLPKRKKKNRLLGPG